MQESIPELDRGPRSLHAWQVTKQLARCEFHRRRRARLKGFGRLCSVEPAEKALAGFQVPVPGLHWTICMYILGHPDGDVNERGLQCLQLAAVKTDVCGAAEMARAADVI